jgi:hypothetical protein
VYARGKCQRHYNREYQRRYRLTNPPKARKKPSVVAYRGALVCPDAHLDTVRRGVEEDAWGWFHVIWEAIGESVFKGLPLEQVLEEIFK